MIIKAIIFDLDGVLIETKELHFYALNQAIIKFDPRFQISYSDHLKKFDGLSTKKKLEILIENGLDPSFKNKIKKKKKISQNIF